MRYSIVLLILIGTSCTQDLKKEVESKVKIEKKDTIIDAYEIETIRVPDSLSNFDALVSSNKVHHLEEMSTNLNDNWNWDRVDTIESDNRLLISKRRGCNPISIGTMKYETCLEKKDYTINRKNNKIIEFSGAGSGYFTTVKFLYDPSGKLIECQSYNVNFQLIYSSDNSLFEVVKTQNNNGIKSKLLKIRFETKTTYNTM